MDYLEWQYIQIALSIALFCLSWITIWRMRISWDKVPFIWVLIGYGLLSAISNLLRWERFDHTALRIITEAEYTQATLWWCASLSVSVAVYLWLLGHSRRWVWKYQSSSNAASSYRLRFYVGASVFLVVLYALNPFRTKDFNILMPQSLSEMAIGGLLVSAFIVNTLATVAVCLLRYKFPIGLLAISLVTWLYTHSGSKGMSAMYLLYLATVVWRHRYQIRLGVLSWLLILGLLVFITIALPLGVKSRYGGSYSFIEAAAIAVGRYTQQDVSAVLWSFSEWREAFAKSYVVDNLLSFFPGFLFAGKPMNPAYAINALYFGGGGPISAASPSLFGAILIVTQEWLYWPVLLLTLIIIYKLDTFFCRHPQVRVLRFDYEWLYFYTLMVLFEATFVIAFGQLLIVFVWRQFLSRQSKTTSVPGRESGPVLPLTRFQQSSHFSQRR